MIASRRADGGSLRPTLAPTWPPTMEPPAISSETICDCEIGGSEKKVMRGARSDHRLFGRPAG